MVAWGLEKGEKKYKVDGGGGGRSGNFHRSVTSTCGRVGDPEQAMSYELKEQQGVKVVTEGTVICI